MAKVTHDHADLLLRLYEMRREPTHARGPRLVFHEISIQPLRRLAEAGANGQSENAYVRMVISYWNMAASIVNRGLIDGTFFFENTGEQWLVCERITAVTSPQCASETRIPICTRTSKNT